ncbi:MAG: zinc ribbon domain-containing protein [Deltaproteobacteria bacterium]|nr:zinc ribbon domain-containing protein [Deltaproteobacteria bacterium]
MSNKRCISCGMPMTKPDEFAANDTSKDYCIHCARQDGSLKSYDEALVGMTAFITHSQGLDENAAREAAKQMMASLPAWKDI